MSIFENYINEGYSIKHHNHNHGFDVSFPLDNELGKFYKQSDSCGCDSFKCNSCDSCKDNNKNIHKLKKYMVGLGVRRYKILKGKKLIEKFPFWKEELKSFYNMPCVLVMKNKSNNKVNKKYICIYCYDGTSYKKMNVIFKYFKG